VLLFSVQGFFSSMGLLRLYRKFYCISTFGSSNVYTLITPTSLSAATYVAGPGGEESSILIESSIPLTEEEIGIFYADLNPELYAEDVTYDLVFYVQYTAVAPKNKRLPVRFRIKTKSVVTNLEYELGNASRIIEVEDVNSFGIEIPDSMNVDLSYKQVEHYINDSNEFEIND
jgi:hypothetical protein